MLDTEQIRRIAREEIERERMAWNKEFFDRLEPFRVMAIRLGRDIYGENPDGSRATGGGLVDMTKRNNTLLWVVLVLSVSNFFAIGVLTFLR